jgi:DNA-binding transcriptional regulator GbsR (MarR family)
MEIKNKITPTYVIYENYVSEELNLNKEKEKITSTLKELKLKLPKKVTWRDDTIDNEHMNKKKSKSITI